MTPALALRAVRVRAGRSVLLDGLDLDVPARGLFGIVGPNGAGKSTLAQAAVGLLPLAGGEASVLGRPLAAWSRRALAQRIGYVPQHVLSHWDLTVAELLQLGMAPVPPALLAACELEAVLARRFGSLSGGEQARAAIARALAHAPALLVADEPAAHLDLPHQHRLMRLLKDRARGGAIVIVLHDLHLAHRYCDQVAVLARGRLVACGAPSDVLTSTALTDAYGDAVHRVERAGGAFFTVDRPTHD
jgi:ABC-type cobalamin/Fe3+-siderophores transport system ATPase subunit